MASIPKNLLKANSKNDLNEFWAQVFNFLNEFDYDYNFEKSGILEKYSIDEETYWNYCGLLASLASHVCDKVSGYSDGSDFWEEVAYTKSPKIANKELLNNFKKLSKEDREDMIEVKQVFGQYVKEKSAQIEVTDVDSENVTQFKEILKYWFKYDGEVSEFFKYPPFQEYVYTYAVKYHG